MKIVNSNYIVKIANVKKIKNKKGVCLVSRLQVAILKRINKFGATFSKVAKIVYIV